MKLLMLWKYYPDYLSYFYEKYPFVVGLPFEEHRNNILNDHFGWPGDLSQYIDKQGIQTEFIIANAESLQKKWAEENNCRYSEDGWEKEIAMEQIRCFQPDVLWITSIFEYFGDFVKKALHYCKKAITWVSCPTPEDLDVSGFTTLITSHPEILKEKQHLFNDVIVTYPGFDSEILKKIGNVKKKYDVTFIGGISPAHSKRAEILAHLIKNGVELKVFGYIYEQPRIGIINGFLQFVADIFNWRVYSGINTLRKIFVKTNYQLNVEIIKSAYHGPVFGLDMYRTIAESRITLNVHIDVAGNHAGNIRMFETTGMGTCLLTEHSDNITELFKPGEEVLTYTSKEELLRIIQEVLAMNENVETIATSGQKRTLQNYTLERLFNDIQPAFSTQDS